MSTCKHINCTKSVPSFVDFCPTHKGGRSPFSPSRLDRDRQSPPGGSLQTSAHSVGPTANLAACDCETPELAVDVSFSDVWRHQTLYCEACDHEFVTLTEQTGGEAE